MLQAPIHEFPNSLVMNSWMSFTVGFESYSFDTCFHCIDKVGLDCEHYILIKDGFQIEIIIAL